MTMTLAGLSAGEAAGHEGPLAAGTEGRGAGVPGLGWTGEHIDIYV